MPIFYRDPNSLIIVAIAARRVSPPCNVERAADPSKDHCFRPLQIAVD
jgi:hypothetical protein